MCAIIFAKHIPDAYIRLECSHVREYVCLYTWVRYSVQELPVRVYIMVLSHVWVSKMILRT